MEEVVFSMTRDLSETTVSSQRVDKYAKIIIANRINSNLNLNLSLS